MQKEELERELIKYKNMLDVMRMFDKGLSVITPSEVLDKINEIEKQLEELYVPIS